MELNKNTMRKLLLLATFVVVLFWGVQNMPEVATLLGTVLGIITPFLLGLTIAFVVNVPMHAIERGLFGRSVKNAKLARMLQMLARPVSLVITFVLLSAVIWVVMFLVLPELVNTLKSIGNAVPQYLENISVWSHQLAQSAPGLGEMLQSLQINWDSVISSVVQFLRSGATSVLNSTVSIANSVFSGVLNFVLGLVFCIYILLQKEKLASQVKRLLYAWLPEHKADGILRVGLLSHRIFSSFITGQCIEAVILGALFFITMSIFKFPYTLMISVLIAFTALIPVFGAFIGCAVGAFMILTVNPVAAFWFLVLFLILQQIEGNLIYPRVVGSSVGLPAIWVLLAVTIGGSAAGVLGMLIGVPLASVLYTLLREASTTRLLKGGIPAQKYHTK